MLDADKPLDPKDEKKLKTRGVGSGESYEPFIKVHEISIQKMKRPVDWRRFRYQSKVQPTN
ncbi:hypothetical protein [Devosia sp.]|uniref:hypothetical protein n=1 Tax=Devosia sp. TaxID=1871048 RepID=UPI003A93BE5E